MPALSKREANRETKRIAWYEVLKQKPALRWLYLLVKLDQLIDQMECLGFGEGFDLYHQLHPNLAKGKALIEI